MATGGLGADGTAPGPFCTGGLGAPGLRVTGTEGDILPCVGGVGRSAGAGGGATGTGLGKGISSFR